jgi:tetratricopeptide (TPR) repeat protein
MMDNPPTTYSTVSNKTQRPNMNVLIAMAGGHQRMMRSVLSSMMVAACLALLSPLATAIPMTPYSKEMTRQQQSEMIDLSGRQDAEAFRDINAMLSAGNYDAAISRAKSVLQRRPNSALANEVLGTAYFLKGEQQKAIPPLNKAIALQPDHSGPITKLGIINMELDRLDEAEELLLQAIKVNPDDRFAHQRLGMLYEYQKKDQQAIRHFHLGLTGTPDTYLGIAVNLGRLLNRAGNYAATVSILKPRMPLRSTQADAQLILATAYLATDQYTDARKRFQRVLQLNKHIPESLLGLAKAQRGEGDLRGAQRAVKKLVELQPNSAEAKLEEGEISLRLGQQAYADAAFDRAVLLGASRINVNQRIARFHLERKEFSQARDIYLAMVDEGSADEITYGQLSELLMGQGDVDKGDQILRKGLEQFPNSAYLHLRLGSYLASIGQYEAALPQLKKATEIVPNDATTWKTYAFALARLGRNDDAASAAKKLYELQSNKLEPAIFYASRLEANGQKEEAEVIYRKVIKAAPDHALALNNLANILAAKKEYREAEIMARRASEIVPDNGSIQDTLGWILYRQGRLKEALSVLDHANRLAPGSATTWYHRGVVLAETGRQAEARASFEKALSLNATADWADDARKRVK